MAQDARPVPVPGPRLWAAARTEADAVVVDIAGPVPLIVEGARLAALAAGQPPPPAHEDPDIRAAVAEVIDDFTLVSGAPDADLEIAFRPADQADAADGRQPAGRPPAAPPAPPPPPRRRD